MSKYYWTGTEGVSELIGKEVWCTDSAYDAKHGNWIYEGELTAIGKDKFVVKVNGGELLWNFITDDIYKEELNYEHYANTDELVEDFRHRFSVEMSPYFMPCIWINHNIQNVKSMVVQFSSHMVSIVDEVENELKCIHLADLLADYTYLDGSPCGKKVGD